MHSSTSSFRPLPGAWRSLAIAVALAILWLSGYEVFWRHRGFAATLTNNEALWCAARARVSAESIVIVGSSRLQRGLDPKLMSEAVGGRSVVQLALDGGNVIPVLADLSHDTSFHGVVVLEYMPKRWFLLDSPGLSRSQSFVASCESPSMVAGVEQKLDQEVQKRFVFMSPELQLMPLLSYVAHEHRLPRNSRDTLREDRLLEEHFRDTTGAGEVDPWDAPLGERDLDARLGQIRHEVAAIRARGGCVVLYRSPVSDGALAEEEAHFPSQQWYSRAAAAIGAVPLDFVDVPALRSIQLPDGSHPDADQLPTITNAISAALRDKLSACGR